MRILATLLTSALISTSALAADLEVPTFEPVEKACPYSFYGLSICGSRPDHYVPNITNPLFNETPFITTEVRGIFLYHNIDNDFALGVPDGGNVVAGAVQARLALTERLGLIATGDGWADINFSSDTGLTDEAGFLNITGGLKYALYQNLEKTQALTVGLRYTGEIQELQTTVIPLGVPLELQGQGGGFFNIFLTGATDLSDFGLPDTVIQASGGANFAIDQEAQNSLAHFSVTASHELFTNFYPVVEFNAFLPFGDPETVLTEATLEAAFPGAGLGPLSQLNGADVVNFGSENATNTITAAIGARYRFTDNIITGLAVERNFVNREDSIFDWRVTGDITLHF